jgi:hypothetical protein
MPPSGVVRSPQHRAHVSALGACSDPRSDPPVSCRVVDAAQRERGGEETVVPAWQGMTAWCGSVGRCLGNRRPSLFLFPFVSDLSFPLSSLADRKRKKIAGRAHLGTHQLALSTRKRKISWLGSVPVLPNTRAFFCSPVVPFFGPEFVCARS